MALTRAEKLLAALPEQEREELEKYISSASRDNTRELYSVLAESVRTGTSFDKERGFQTLYGRPHSKEEDYLLRNELRLLTGRIYDYLVEKTRREEIRNNECLYDMLLLEGLLERRLFTEFESALQKSYEKAIHKLEFRNAYRMKELYFRYQILHQEISPDVMGNAHAAMMENLGNIKRQYLMDVAANQHNRVVCEQNLLAMRKQVEQTAIGMDADFDEYDTAYSRYFQEESLAHQTTGIERIEHARIATEYIAEIADRTMKFSNHMMLSYAILGSSYLMERQYEPARQAFEKGIAFACEHNIPPRLDMVFNYASTLMKLRMFDSVLKLYDTHATEIETAPQVRFKFECLRCFCYIFQRQPKRVLEIIPPDISQRPEAEYQYLRFIYTILPYLVGDLENGLREANNFVVYFNRHKDRLLFPQEKTIATFYKKFYTCMLDVMGKGERDKKLKEIANNLNEYVQEHPLYTGYLYIAWLEEEITALTA